MKNIFRSHFVAMLLVIACSISGTAQSPTLQKNPNTKLLNCDLDLGFCQERVTHIPGADKYIGHDEPSVAFYSNVAGSGNSAIYLLTLPLEPPSVPVQDGGGTFNFELHPAFWFGMN